MEKFSLESDEFLSLERDLNHYFNEFYSDKRQIPNLCDFEDFEKDQELNFKRFLHEYEMGFTTKFKRKLVVTTELSPTFQKYIIYVSRFLCERGTSLKPAYTVQGKQAEGAVMFAINNWMNYLGSFPKLSFNRKSFFYNGDQGSDFSLGQYRIDVKHRDDSPASGLFLGSRYLEEAEDDILLVLCTNASNIKLGSFFNKESAELITFDEIALHLRERSFPLAITGWTTVGDYKKEASLVGNSHFSNEKRYVCDDLKPIIDLFITFSKDYSDSQKLFI